ncbi:MAG: NTP transferase domain-containing protein [Candidatus Aenigmarchaeota archaeon]|nr:NTP transferase domain-containing protein [Candidatus Aenigmarchaeota archaeon]
MQAVLLAAGECSRFKPLSDGMHKCMVSIFGKTIIERTVENLKQIGITDIIIVQSPKSNIKTVLGDGSSLGVNIKYVVQKESKGMGDAVLLAEKYIDNAFFVLNANSFEVLELLDLMQRKFKKTGAGNVLLGKKTNMPWNYGIVALDTKVKDKVVNLIEKPVKGKEPSDIRLVGIYFLPQDFFEYYRRVKVHQYAFEDALKLYMGENDTRIVMTDKGMPTMKYPWDLFNVSDIMFSGMKSHISKSAKVDKSAKIEGLVHIGKNTKVFENAVIKGPCYIGDNCVVGNNALIRNSVIEAKSIVGANCEVARTIILKGTHIHSGFFGDTIIGENCRIGAGMITGNVRIDRDEITSEVKGSEVSTNMNSFGVIIGHNTRVGIHVSTMPGVIIGSGCTVGPNTVVMKNIDPNMICYSKFENIVKKRK